VAATERNGTLLGQACERQREEFDHYSSVVERLAASAERRAARHPSATGGDKATRRSAYDDSLRTLPRPSQTAIDSLAVTLATTTAAIDSSGHFSVRSVPRGAYYLVMPGIGWWGVDGKQWPAHTRILMHDMQDACSAIG